MIARRSLRIAVFGFCLVSLSLVTSCSFLSSDDTSSNADQESSSADAQKAAESARKLLVQPDELDKARREAEQARSTANKLKDQADKMTAATLRDRKDPNNPSVAPNTHKAIQDHQKAEDEARHEQQEFEQLRIQDEKARRDLEQANAALAVAKQRESSNAARRSGTETNRSSTSTSNYSMPSWAALLTAVGGFIVLGLLFWLTWRMISDNHTKTERLIREQEGNQSYRSTTALSALKQIKTQLTELQTEVSQLSELMQTDRRERQDRRQPVADAPPVTPPHYEPPVEVQEEEPLQFPTSASTLLTRLGGHKPIIKLDPVRGLLVTDWEGGGHLVLVQDRNIPGGVFYIVPRITRFQTKEEFYNHYEQYYDCNLPAAGEVWLQRLAVVDKVDGGWQLHDKGLMEIR